MVYKSVVNKKYNAYIQNNISKMELEYGFQNLCIMAIKLIVMHLLRDNCNYLTSNEPSTY